MKRRASSVTEISVFATREISVTGLEIFPYGHSSPVTGMKLENSRLVQAEISHMNGNRAEILGKIRLFNRASPVSRPFFKVIVLTCEAKACGTVGTTAIFDEFSLK